MNITAFAPPPPNVSTVALKAAVAPKNQSLTETPADSFTPSSVAQRSGATIVSASSSFDFLLEPRTLIEYLAQAGKALVTGPPSKVFPEVCLGLRGLEAIAQKLEKAGFKVVTFHSEKTEKELDKNLVQEIEENGSLGFPWNLAIQKSDLTAKELQLAIQKVTGLPSEAFNDYAILMETDGDLF